LICSKYIVRQRKENREEGMHSFNPTLTTCTFCGVGCGIYLEKSGGLITGAYPSMSHPANQGKICVRGWHVHEVASSPDRLKNPLLRVNGDFQEVSWQKATDFIVERLTKIFRESGPDSVGFLNSPRCSNEESYLLQKFARTVIGTNNVHHGGPLHRQNTIQTLIEMIGVPAATNSIGELEKSEAIIVDGIDLGRQLPTIGGRVIRAKLNGAKLIVTGSRRHRVAEQADYFLQIKPDTDLLLYGAMAKVIVDRGLVDYRFVRQHCHGFEAWLQTIQDFNLLAAADRCGIEVELIENAAIAYARARSAAILYSTGVEARGVEPIQALVNLALLTGNVGREGGGLMPLAEYNNLQGICDMGVMPDRLPGYRPVSDPKARKALEKLWGKPVPPNPGRDIWSMLGSGDTPLRAVWIDRHNPVATAALCDAAQVLEQADLVVLQHMFMTNTAKYADVILPLVAFGEEDVTYTSTERRVQIAQKAIDPPPGPIPAWHHLVIVANKMGARWSYASSSDVLDEIAKAVPFYSGISYENLGREYGRQWPCTTDKKLGTGYLFEDGLPEAGFQFAAVHRPPDAASRPTDDYPFYLSLGYSLYYWHRNVLIQHSETLRREYGILLLDYPEGFIEINGQDAKRLNIRDGAKVRLVGQVGSAVSTARVTDEIRPGTVFVPYFQQEIARQIVWTEGARKSNVDNPVFVRVEKA